MNEIKDMFKYFGLLGGAGLVVLLNIAFGLLLYKGWEILLGENIFIFLICILFGLFGGGYSVYRLIFKE